MLHGKCGFLSNWLDFRSSIAKDGRNRSREPTVSYYNVSSRLSAPQSLANLVCFAMLPPPYFCAWFTSLTEAQSKAWTERRWILKAWSSDVLPPTKPLLDYPKQHRHPGMKCSNGWAFRGHLSVKLPQVSTAQRIILITFEFSPQEWPEWWGLSSFLCFILQKAYDSQWLIPVTYMTHVP